MGRCCRDVVISRQARTTLHREVVVRLDAHGFLELLDSRLLLFDEVGKTRFMLRETCTIKLAVLSIVDDFAL